VTLKVGQWARGELTFTKRVLAAVREGSIDAIDAGAVVGPKALHAIATILKQAPSGKTLVVHGYLTPTVIRGRALMQLRQQGPDTPPEKAWPRSEVKRYRSALKTLGLYEACSSLLGVRMNRAGRRTLYFRIESGPTPKATWAEREVPPALHSKDTFGDFR